VELHPENLYGIDIIELGSGDCSKISLILQSATKHEPNVLKYIPFDVSIEALLESAQVLTNIFPNLEVHCIVGDFFFQLDKIPFSRKKLFCFFGSTIGNFSYAERLDFFRNISLLMNPGDIFLLGVDMIKDQILLENAYNDSQKVTSLFNLNILNVVNSLTGTDFNPEHFEHLAFFNRTFSRMEMHLQALQNITVQIAGLSTKFYIPKGETIHTENSYKFTYDQIVRELQTAQLQVSSFLSDSNNWFSLFEIVKSNL
ncbi:MAG: L-histidine N(alpha)-methyltransferase, partial [Fibrobacter sp.]|nr:L-histidine N(alpha)-methyltransferase [Fibrobacter sp.]